jgi:pyrimidine-nucleoside phosphorylase
MAREALDNGSAWEKFRLLVQAQDGDVRFIDRPERLPSAALVETVCSPRDGYVGGVNARLVGETAVILGAGRIKKGDPVDHAVGIEVLHKVGDRVKQDDPLFNVHANKPEILEEAKGTLLKAVSLSGEPVEPLPLFYGVIGAQ